MADRPTFSGYVAIPSAHGDAILVAYWSDGRAARLIDRMDEAEWFPLPTPDYAALWPSPVPVAPIADARYGVALPFSDEWQCSCGRILPNAHLGCGQCFDVNPRLRPT